MSDAALVMAGLAMGVAATPHCALMCSAPCAALGGPRRRDAALVQAGRLAGYMAAGAVAAASVQAIGAWSQSAPVLRPLWLLMQMGFLAMGAWWLAMGRPPRSAWRDGAVAVAWHGHGARSRTVRAAIGGLAWVAWPCGVLQGGLMLASLGGNAIAGAAVMAAFALGSMPGLVLAPWAWSRWRAARRGMPGAAALVSVGYRIAGAAIVAASGWALTQGLWQKVAAWCAV